MVHARAKAVAVGLVVLGSLLVAPPTAQAATKVSAAEQETILALHNQYRAAAGVGPARLGRPARRGRAGLGRRAWSRAAARWPTPTRPTPTTRRPARPRARGRTSRAGSPPRRRPPSGTRRSRCSTPPRTSPGFNDTNPDWVNWGHYTQMMWSATTKIGCGTAPGPRYQITSCRYSPPGNFDGQLPYPNADTLPGRRGRSHRNGRSRKRRSRPSDRRLRADRVGGPPTTDHGDAPRPRPPRGRDAAGRPGRARVTRGARPGRRRPARRTRRGRSSARRSRPPPRRPARCRGRSRRSRRRRPGGGRSPSAKAWISVTLCRPPYATPVTSAPATRSHGSPARPTSTRPAAPTTSSGPTNRRVPQRSDSPPICHRHRAAAAVRQTRASTAVPVSGASWAVNVSSAPPALVASRRASSGRQIRTRRRRPDPLGRGLRRGAAGRAGRDAPAQVRHPRPRRSAAPRRTPPPAGSRTSPAATGPRASTRAGARRSPGRRRRPPGRAPPAPRGARSPSPRRR